MIVTCSMYFNTTKTHVHMYGEYHGETLRVVAPSGAQASPKSRNKSQVSYKALLLLYRN